MRTRTRTEDFRQGAVARHRFSHFPSGNRAAVEFVTSGAKIGPVLRRTVYETTWTD